jgi:hypothetical protein
MVRIRVLERREDGLDALIGPHGERVEKAVTHRGGRELCEERVRGVVAWTRRQVSNCRTAHRLVGIGDGVCERGHDFGRIELRERADRDEPSRRIDCRCSLAQLWKRAGTAADPEPEQRRTPHVQIVGAGRFDERVLRPRIVEVRE